MQTAKSILKSKGSDIFSLSPDDSVYQAIELMAEKHVGAVLVVSDDQLVGIMSERDYARKVVLKGKMSKQTAVKDIMSSPVFFVSPDFTVDQCMQLMTLRRVRHLPVIEKGKIVGVLSIGDLVKTIIEEQAQTIEHLERYITGKYPG